MNLNLNSKLSFPLSEIKRYKHIWIGSLSIIIAISLYSAITNPYNNTELLIDDKLKNIAVVFYLILTLNLISITTGVIKLFNDKVISKFNYLSTTHTNLLKNYKIILAISTIGYGITFAFLSQMFVFTGNNSNDLNNKYPTIDIIPCCNKLGYVPIILSHVTEQFYIMILPLNLLINYSISILVGINVTIGIFSYFLYKQNIKKTVYGSLGMFTGLFVGCPTCAGSLFSVIMGLGMNSSIIFLSSTQLIFVLATIPILILGPILTVTSINKGCKIKI